MNDITVITQSAQLSEYCSDWRKAAYVTVDTEFMREHTYWPKLCLVQVGGPDESVVIDPLAEGIDLTPLYELLINPNVLKVFHAARQDDELFHHLTGQVPTPLFDTQLAAMVCGFGDSVGYEKLAARLADAQLDTAVGKQVECAHALGHPRRVIGSELDDAVRQADLLRALAGCRQEHLRSRGVRVLLEEVVLDLPGVVVAELVGQLDLV